GDRLQRSALMGSIAFDGFDQVGDQVVALFELDVDVGEGLVDALPHGNQAVVDRDCPYNEQYDDADDNPGSGGHGGGLLKGPRFSTEPAYPRRMSGKRTIETPVWPAAHAAGAKLMRKSLIAGKKRPQAEARGLFVR